MIYAKRRDKCERDIVLALRSIGASVQQLDARGVPDLLVGLGGRMWLIECKDPDDGARNSRSSGRKVGNPLGLRESQWEWWRAWKGPTPHVVTTPAEAIAIVRTPPAP